MPHSIETTIFDPTIVFLSTYRWSQKPSQRVPFKRDLSFASFFQKRPVSAHPASEFLNHILTKKLAQIRTDFLSASFYVRNDPVAHFPTASSSLPPHSPPPPPPRPPASLYAHHSENHDVLRSSAQGMRRAESTSHAWLPVSFESCHRIRACSVSMSSISMSISSISIGISISRVSVWVYQQWYS